MSSLKERKQTQKNKTNGSNPTYSDKNNSNWGAYGKGVLNSILNIILLCLVGFGFLYSVKHLGFEKYLPTNLMKMPYNPPKNMPFSKSLPYVPFNMKNPNLGESLSQILGASMSQVRSLTQLMFKSISHLNESKILTYVDYAFFILSIFILPIISFALPWAGVLGGVLHWWNLKTDLFVKIGAFILMGFVLFGTFMYQHIYPLLFIGFALYQMKQDKMFGYYAKQMKHFIYFLIMAAVILPAFGTLWYPFIIGMVGAGLMPYIPTIIGLVL
jgi:hypothetical protein